MPVRRVKCCPRIIDRPLRNGRGKIVMMLNVLTTVGDSVLRRSWCRPLAGSFIQCTRLLAPTSSPHDGAEMALTASNGRLRPHGLI